jgi:hypothetical protein
MANGESTQKCGACVKQLQSVREENTPSRSFGSVSPNFEFILPPLKDNDSLRVQLGTFRLNGVCTKNVIGNLIHMVLKLSEKSGHLHKDNEVLEMKTERPSVACVQD